MMQVALGRTALYIKTSSTNQPVVAITLNKTTSTFNIGDTDTLSATVGPAHATNQTVTWSSSNSSVATVSSSGVVTGVTTGTAIITCTANDGSGETATCTVTVVYPKVAEKFENGDLTWGDIHNISGIISSRFGLTSNDINKTTHEVLVTYQGVTYQLEVGDSFILKSTDNKRKYYVRIIGFNTDKLAGDSKVTTATATTYVGDYAGITFELYTGQYFLFDENYGSSAMNPGTETNPDGTNVGGWGASYVREALNLTQTVTALENGSYIKYVSKEYNIGNKGSTNAQTPSIDRLWILGGSEIWPLKNNEYGWCNTNESTMTEGINETRYRYYVEANADCDTANNVIIKKYTSSSTNTNYWIRSPRYKDTTSFFYVYKDGKISREKAGGIKGVFPCFCI